MFVLYFSPSQNRSCLDTKGTDPWTRLWKCNFVPGLGSEKKTNLSCDKLVNLWKDKSFVDRQIIVNLSKDKLFVKRHIMFRRTNFLDLVCIERKKDCLLYHFIWNMEDHLAPQRDLQQLKLDLNMGNVLQCQEMLLDEHWSKADTFLPAWWPHSTTGSWQSIPGCYTIWWHKMEVPHQ